MGLEKTVKKREKKFTINEIPEELTDTRVTLTRSFGCDGSYHICLKANHKRYCIDIKGNYQFVRYIPAKVEILKP